MSTKYKATTTEDAYFITITTVGWVDVFTRLNQKYIITDSLKHCQQNKGLEIYAYCIMSNHIHLFCKATNGFILSDVMRDFKKFTSKQIVKTVQEEPESRREWMLDYFQKSCEHLKKEQKYKVLVKKGTSYQWKECVIKDIALPFWNKAVFGARKDDYIFSTGLVPGPKKLTYSAIRLRWKRNVKTMLNITADFYSLKHLNLDETTELLSLEDAARMGNHTNINMVSNVYAVGEKQRQFEKLKKVGNSL
mgnify:CR=1 FL=1